MRMVTWNKNRMSYLRETGMHMTIVSAKTSMKLITSVYSVAVGKMDTMRSTVWF